MKHISYFKKILGVLGVCIVGFGVVYTLTFFYIKNTNEKISTLQNSLAQDIKTKEYFSSTKAVVDQSLPAISQIKSSIVAQDGDIAFIEGVEKMARDNNLEITIDSLAFDDDPVLADSGVTFLHVRAKTKGTWSGLYHFVREIETMQYKVKVDQFDLVNTGDATSLDQKSKGTGQWQGLVDMRVLKYK